MAHFFWRMAVQLETPLRQDSVVDMVTNSGLVVQSVLYLLMSFSVISWGIVLYKFRQIRQARNESERFNVVFWETKNLSAIHTASLDAGESGRPSLSRRLSGTHASHPPAETAQPWGE